MTARSALLLHIVKALVARARLLAVLREHATRTETQACTRVGTATGVDRYDRHASTHKNTHPIRKETGQNCRGRRRAFEGCPHGGHGHAILDAVGGKLGLHGAQDGVTAYNTGIVGSPWTLVQPKRTEHGTTAYTEAHPGREMPQDLPLNFKRRQKNHEATKKFTKKQEIAESTFVETIYQTEIWD